MRKILLAIMVLCSFCFADIGGQILDANDDPYTITTVFDQNDLRSLQYVQSNDVMYIVCPDKAPQKLSRYDHANWTIETVEWQWGPFLTQNDTATTITPSAATGSITLEASGAIFDANHVGALWKITEKADNTAISGTLDANESSGEITIEGDGLLTLEGSWQGIVTLEKSLVDADSWEPVYPKYNPDVVSVNTEYSFSEESPGYEYRVTMTDYASGSCDYSLVAYNNDVAGYVEITAVTDSNTATATVKSTLAGTAATTKWAEGAWSDYRGWPRAVCLYQNRLCLAGTSYQPSGFWASAAGGDFENMRDTGLDNGAISYEAASAKQNPILWLQDKNGIIAGTSGSVLRIFSQSNTSTLTPATIGSERQSDGGSCNIQAALSGDSIIYVDRGRKIVRDLVYDLQSDGFITPNLTTFAEHITDPCIVEFAWQQRPDQIGWFVLGDGTMATLTYNNTEKVLAWSKQETEGDFESVAVIPNSTDEDEVWVAVKRTIDGNTVRYIEQFGAADWGTDTNDCFFVDSGLTYDGNATSTLTGLSHLEGKTVQVFYDGNSVMDCNVLNGQIDVNTADPNLTVTQATVGLAYTSLLKTFPVELQLDTGFSIGVKKHIPKIYGCFYKTMYGDYAVGGEYVTPTWWPIPFTTWPTASMGSDSPFTGQIPLPTDGGWFTEPFIEFRQDEPFPFGLTGISTKIEVGDN